MTLVDQLKRDEGVRLKPYKDSVGKITIGIGRNLDDVGISATEAESLLANDIARAQADLAHFLPWTAQLDEVRRGALVNLAFNMGIHSLLEFRNTLELIRTGKYQDAADALMFSKYAHEVGPRAHRLAVQIATGIWQ